MVDVIHTDAGVLGAGISTGTAGLFNKKICRVNVLMKVFKISGQMAVKCSLAVFWIWIHCATTREAGNILQKVLPIPIKRFSQ